MPDPSLDLVVQMVQLVRCADRSPVAGTMIDAPVKLAGCRAVPDFGAPALGYAE
jgi:hypothetical protein